LKPSSLSTSCCFSQQSAQSSRTEVAAFDS
jgi:hypothetical protein